MKQDQEKKMYFYESFADDFDSKMNKYDLNKRIEVVFNEMLDMDLKGKKLLDAGCGTGWFSKAASERGAEVTSMDIGDKLLSKVAVKCNSKCVIGSIMDIPFDDNTFDIIISSEVIEHVTNPTKAIRELYRVLKPQGTLVLTTPNKIWYFSIWIANTFKLRHYQGLENWMGWYELKKELRDVGFINSQMSGIHLFPFISPVFYPLLNFFHKFNKFLGPVMLNMAVKAQKP